MTKVFICVLDGCGAGELPDAAAYGDAGSATLRHVLGGDESAAAPGGALSRSPTAAGPLLTPADVPALRALRRLVLESLPHPDYYRVEGESSDFVAKILTPGSKAHGLILGVFQKEILMAYGALEFPGPGEVNRGVDLSLPVDQLPLVAHMTSAMVAPSHQGRGLHDFLIAARLEAGVAQGRRHFLTTVSPRNHPSWGNLVARAR